MKELVKLPMTIHFSSHRREMHTLKEHMFVSLPQRSSGGGWVVLQLAGENLFLREAFTMTVAVNWYVEFIDHSTAGKSSAIFDCFLGHEEHKKWGLKYSDMSIAGNKHDVQYVMEPTLNHAKWNYKLCSGIRHDSEWIWCRKVILEHLMKYASP